MEKKALPSTAHLCSLLPSGCHSYNNMTGTGFEETELNHPEIQQQSLLGCCGASRKTYLKLLYGTTALPARGRLLCGAPSLCKVRSASAHAD